MCTDVTLVSLSHWMDTWAVTRWKPGHSQSAPRSFVLVCFGECHGNVPGAESENYASQHMEIKFLRYEAVELCSVQPAADI